MALLTLVSRVSHNEIVGTFVWRHCTVFRKAYILSGSSFHEFLYSIIESLKKIVKLLRLSQISCVFTKNTLANFRDMEILHKRGNRKVPKKLF